MPHLSAQTYNTNKRVEETLLCLHVWLQSYWYWVIRYWTIFADIG